MRMDWESLEKVGYSVTYDGKYRNPWLARGPQQGNRSLIGGMAWPSEHATFEEARMACLEHAIKVIRDVEPWLQLIKEENAIED